MPKTPLEEISKRAAEAGSGLAAAAKAVALQDHQRMLRDNASRVRDGHRAMMKAAGFEPSETSDDEMGDIIITGDITQTGATPAPTAPAGTSTMSTAGKLAVGAGLLASGAGLAAGAPLILDALRPAPPAAVVPADPPSIPSAIDTDTQYELELQ